MAAESHIQLLKAASNYSDSIQLGSHCIPYQLLRSKRRSIGFLLNSDGLRVTAPHRISLAEITSAIHSKQHWIITRLEEIKSRPAPPLPTKWTTGATLPFLGHLATVSVAYSYNASTHFDNATSLINLNLPSDSTPELCKKHLLAWLMSQARRQFSFRLAYFAERLNVKYHSFSLSNANTRWGSCNSQGKIRLNWRLIHFSPHLIDYVIAHELAHLHEMNHSPRFWAKVGQVFPDYQAARNELKLLELKALPLF